MNLFFGILSQAARMGQAWGQKRFDINQGAALDRASGLTWLLCANPAGWPMFFTEALEYVAGLNASKHLGFSDWRLPNRRELFSLMDHGQANPALAAGHPFTEVQPAWYWSSTSYAGDPAYAWYAHTEGGRMFYGDKNRSYFVWPVRGMGNLAVTGQRLCYADDGSPRPCAGSGQDGEIQAGRRWPSPRFSERGLVVFDNLSGLAWSKWADQGPGAVSWRQAREIAARLHRERFAGLAGWRLPTIAELELIVDASQHHPALAPGHFFEGLQDQYWSGTTSAFDPDWAMALYLDKGGIGVGMKGEAHYAVWVVCGP